MRAMGMRLDENSKYEDIKSASGAIIKGIFAVNKTKLFI